MARARFHELQRDSGEAASEERACIETWPDTDPDCCCLSLLRQQPHLRPRHCKATPARFTALESVTIIWSKTTLFCWEQSRRRAISCQDEYLPHAGYGGSFVERIAHITLRNDALTWLCLNRRSLPSCVAFHTHCEDAKLECTSHLNHDRGGGGTICSFGGRVSKS